MAKPPKRRITAGDLVWRRKNLARSIELAYGSAKTHFRDAIKGSNAAFDAEAIREYAEIMLISATELEFLAIEAGKTQGTNAGSSIDKARSAS